MVRKENHKFMIKKGGTAEYFGPLWDGNAWRFLFLIDRKLIQKERKT